MKFRLLHAALLIALATVATALAAIAVTYRVADEELRDILADDLEHQCRMLARVLAAGPAASSPGGVERLLRQSFRPDDEETLWVNVYDVAGGAPASNLRHRLPLASPRSGPVAIRWDGHDWSGYQHREGALVVQLLRRDDLYAGLQAEILEDITAPVLAGSLVMLLLLAALIGGLLSPLARLGRELEARAVDSLAPVDVRTPVAEMETLVATLNRLFAGIDAVLRRERQFANDVAHELRTPLTTLKLELADPEPDLPAIREEVNRLSRLVGQLLTLARLDQGRWQGSFQAVDLAGLWAAEARRLAGAIQAAGIVLTADVVPARVQGDPTLLQVLIGNLVDNVLGHCPAGSTLEVALADDAGTVTLAVSDDGPGIPAPQRAQMNAGFTRLDSRSEGLGLGLAICRRIADVHGATLAFEGRADGRSGLRVVLRLPP